MSGERGVTKKKDLSFKIHTIIITFRKIPSVKRSKLLATHIVSSSISFSSLLLSMGTDMTFWERSVEPSSMSSKSTSLRACKSRSKSSLQ